MTSPLPFPSNGVPVVGQPFMITAATVPINITLTCNCGTSPGPIEILASREAECLGCGKHYGAAFNPITKQIEMRIYTPIDQEPIA